LLDSPTLDELLFLYIKLCKVYVPVKLKLQHPPPRASPQASPRAFELLKIGLLNFPPLGEKKAVQMPHQLVLKYLSSKANVWFQKIIIHTPPTEGFLFAPPSP